MPNSRNSGINFTVRNLAITGGAAFEGAGISNGGTLTVTNSTLSGNSAISEGGGNISNYSPDGSQATVEIGNSILNAGSPGGNISNGGTFTSRGYNLSSDAAGGDGTTGPGGLLSATGDIRNTDPLLGPLQANGGPTATHALLPGSPAIDQGKRDTILALASNTDQRGFLRPVDDPTLTNASGGDGSDIGAFEVQRPARAPVPVASPTGLLAVAVLLSTVGCLTLRRPARSHSSEADASVGA